MTRPANLDGNYVDSTNSYLILPSTNLSTDDLREWSNLVKKRDNFQCIICARSSVELHAHHLLPKARFPERMFELDNGVTLCWACHCDVHLISNLKLGIRMDKEQCEEYQWCELEKLTSLDAWTTFLYSRMNVNWTKNKGKKFGKKPQRKKYVHQYGSCFICGGDNKKLFRDKLCEWCHVQVKAFSGHATGWCAFSPLPDTIEDWILFTFKWVRHYKSIMNLNCDDADQLYIIVNDKLVKRKVCAVR